MQTWHLLRKVGFGRTARVLQRLIWYRLFLRRENLPQVLAKLHSRNQNMTALEVEAFFRVVTGLDRRIFSELSCLRVSLVMAEFLPAPKTFILGAQKNPTDFSAHAWVKWQDRIFSTESTDAFTELKRFEL